MLIFLILRNELRDPGRLTRQSRVLFEQLLAGLPDLPATHPSSPGLPAVHQIGKRVHGQPGTPEAHHARSPPAARPAAPGSGRARPAAVPCPTPPPTRAAAVRRP